MTRTSHLTPDGPSCLMVDYKKDINFWIKAGRRPYGKTAQTTLVKVAVKPRIEEALEGARKALGKGGES